MWLKERKLFKSEFKYRFRGNKMSTNQNMRGKSLFFRLYLLCLRHIESFLFFLYVRGCVRVPCAGTIQHFVLPWI